MSIQYNAIKKNLSQIWVYNLSFILLFDFIFLRTFSDGGETFGMFIIFSFVLQILTTFFFALASLIFKLISFKQNNIINAVLLFIISEISILVMTGDISLFGLFETQDLNLSPDLGSSLMKFHKQRDLALSISGLLSCIIYFMASVFKRKIINNESDFVDTTSSSNS